MATKLCPFFQSECKKEACQLWDSLPVTNPATHQPDVIFGCSFNLSKHLAHENAMQQRSTGAAIDKLRNELQVNHQEAMAVTMTAADMLKGSTVKKLESQ